MEFLPFAAFLLVVMLIGFVLQQAQYVAHYWRAIYKPVFFEVEPTPSEEIREIWSEHVAALEPLGFRRVLEYRFTSFTGHAEYGVCLQRDSSGDFALFATSANMDTQVPVRVTLCSAFADGSVLQSAPGVVRILPGNPPGLESVAAGAGTYEVFVQRHEETVAARHTPRASIEAPELLRRIESSWRAYLEEQAREGRLEVLPERNGYAWNLRSAIRIHYAMYRYQRQVAAMAKEAERRRLREQQSESEESRSADGVAEDQTEATPPQVARVPVSLEAEFYRASEVQPVRAPSVALRLKLLFVTLVLGLISFSVLFDLELALVLLCILTIHEGGHFLAMRATGHENLSVFFLPFLGAAAMGTKQNASLRDSVVVLLAGPLPGLLAGLLLAQWIGLGRYRILDMMVVTAVLLNYLNLLPFVPLDGGRVVVHLLMSKHVYGRIVFQIIAALAFLVVGLLTKDPILFAFAFLAGAGLPTGIRQARTLADLMAHASRDEDGEENGQLAAMFHRLRELGLGTLPYVRKAQLIRSVRELQKAPDAGVEERVGWAAVYLTALVATPFWIYSTVLLHLGWFHR